MHRVTFASIYDNQVAPQISVFLRNQYKMKIRRVNLNITEEHLL